MSDTKGLRGLIDELAGLEGIDDIEDPQTRTEVREALDTCVARARELADLKDAIEARPFPEVEDVDDDDDVSMDLLMRTMKHMAVRVIEFDVVRYQKNLHSYASTVGDAFDKSTLAMTAFLIRVMDAEIALGKLRLALRDLCDAELGGEDAEE